MKEVGSQEQSATGFVFNFVSLEDGIPDLTHNEVKTQIKYFYVQSCTQFDVKFKYLKFENKFNSFQRKEAQLFEQKPDSLS